MFQVAYMQCILHGFTSTLLYVLSSLLTAKSVNLAFAHDGFLCITEIICIFHSGYFDYRVGMQQYIGIAIFSATIKLIMNINILRSTHCKFIEPKVYRPSACNFSQHLHCQPVILTFTVAEIASKFPGVMPSDLLEGSNFALHTVCTPSLS